MLFNVVNEKIKKQQCNKNDKINKQKKVNNLTRWIVEILFLFLNRFAFIYTRLTVKFSCSIKLLLNLKCCSLAIFPLLNLISNTN